MTVIQIQIQDRHGKEGKGVRNSSKSPLSFSMFCKAVQATRQGSEMAVLRLRRTREEVEEPTCQ